MPASASRLLAQACSGRRFYQLLQAEALDEFAQGSQVLLQATLPLHSIRISFNDLEFFRPSLIRDTMPMHGDVSYLFERNLHDPTPAFLRRHLGINVSNCRAQLAGAGATERMKTFGQFMRREGWDKDAEVYFWDGHALEAYLCVRRSPEQPDFNADELKFLEDFRRALGASVHRLRNRHREKLTTDCLQLIIATMPIPVLLLDWQLDPISFNPEARQLCAEWLYGAQAGRAVKLAEFTDVPVEIVRGCSEGKAEYRQSAPSGKPRTDRFAPPFQTVRHPTRTGLFAQIELLEANRGTIGMPHFLVRLQRSEPGMPLHASAPSSARADLAALSCLSRREREIALQVGTGRTNREIAQALSKSVSTVKMQLQSIFRKLGVGNRAGLVARLYHSRAAATSTTAV